MMDRSGTFSTGRIFTRRRSGACAIQWPPITNCFSLKTNLFGSKDIQQLKLAGGINTSVSIELEVAVAAAAPRQMESHTPDNYSLLY